MPIRKCLLPAMLLLCVSILSGCAAPQNAEQGTTIQQLADEYLAAFLERYPETGTYYAIPGQRHEIGRAHV